MIERDVLLLVILLANRVQGGGGGCNMRRWMSRKFDKEGDGTRIYSVIDLLQVICHGVGGEGGVIAHAWPTNKIRTFVFQEVVTVKPGR